MCVCLLCFPLLRVAAQNKWDMSAASLGLDPEIAKVADNAAVADMLAHNVAGLTVERCASTCNIS